MTPRILCCAWPLLLLAACASAPEVQVPAELARDGSGTNPARRLTKELPPRLAEEAQVEKVLFPIRNDSPEVVTIRDLRQSCSCANATISTRTLAPGEAAALELTVDLRRRSGPQHLTCA